MCFAPRDQLMGQLLHVSLELECSTHHFGLRFCQLLTELRHSQLRLLVLFRDVCRDMSGWVHILQLIGKVVVQLGVRRATRPIAQHVVVGTHSVVLLDQLLGVVRQVIQIELASLDSSAHSINLGTLVPLGERIEQSCTAQITKTHSLITLY